MNRRHGLRTMRRLSADIPLTLRGQRIGIMGGSFNPPHTGHLDAAHAALTRLDLDRIWWLVTPGNPLKPQNDLEPLAARIALCRRLITDPRIIATGFEAGLSTAFTAETLDALLAQRSQTNFVWIMGADNLSGFHQWYRWRSIIESVPIAVIDRPGWRLAAMSSPAARAYANRRLPEGRAKTLARHRPPVWVYLTVPQNPLSSTDLRQD